MFLFFVFFLGYASGERKKKKLHRQFSRVCAVLFSRQHKIVRDNELEGKQRGRRSFLVRPGKWRERREKNTRHKIKKKRKEKKKELKREKSQMEGKFRCVYYSGSGRTTAAVSLKQFRKYIYIYRGVSWYIMYSSFVFVFVFWSLLTREQKENGSFRVKVNSE